jgi:hypothetical protein
MKKQLFVLSIIVLMLFGFSSTSMGSERDQGQIFSTGGDLELETDEWSQSITTGISGQLTEIKIQFHYGVPPQPPALSLSIFEGGNPISGTALFSQQLSISSADLGADNVFTWDLRSADLIFNVGDVFSFVLQADGTGYNIAGNDPPGYTGGELFKNGMVSTELSDIAFITYVDSVPGPIHNPENGHYYQLVEVQGSGLSWYDAKDAAEAMEYKNMKGHLATLTSPEEEKLVLDSFPKIVPNYVWLGATDEHKEDEWKWITGETWSYTNWDSGEPNGGIYENCLDYSDGIDKWNDESCERPLKFFLVEYSLPLINDLVTFEPDPSTYEFISDTEGCQAGAVGKFTFDAKLTNISQKTLSNLFIEVDELTNNNLLLTSNGLVGEGARFPITRIDRIEALIDGRSQLILQDNTAQWYHLDFAAPGRHEFRNDPTVINGVEWFPLWPDIPDEENRDCNCYSDVFTGLYPPLPSEDFTVKLKPVRSRSETQIIQEPANENDYTLIIEFDDNAPGGSDSYIVELELEHVINGDYSDSTLSPR